MGQKTKNNHIALLMKCFDLDENVFKKSYVAHNGSSCGPDAQQHVYVMAVFLWCVSRSTPGTFVN